MSDSMFDGLINWFSSKSKKIDFYTQTLRNQKALQFFKEQQKEHFEHNYATAERNAYGQLLAIQEKMVLPAYEEIPIDFNSLKHDPYEYLTLQTQTIHMLNNDIVFQKSLPKAKHYDLSKIEIMAREESHMPLGLSLEDENLLIMGLTENQNALIPENSTKWGTLDYSTEFRKADEYRFVTG